MVVKLSMYVGLHNVYPATDVHLAFRRNVKMTATSDFASLGEKVRELLVKKRERKRKEKRYKY